MVTFEKEILLQVNHLSTGYGKRQVLFDVSLEVSRGEIVLLTGGNGSGKSTLLKAIYGLVTTGLKNMPDSQNWIISPFYKFQRCIYFDNEDITCIKPYQLIKKGLVYVPQKNNSFEQLTVIDNLKVVGTYLNKRELRNRIDNVFEQLPQLTMLKERKPFHLSGGERQLLALGIAVMQQPKMVLLDEPSAGLSPGFWKSNLELIKSLNKTGITFLIVEHRLKECLEIANRVIGLKFGTIFIQSEVNPTFELSSLNSLFI